MAFTTRCSWCRPSWNFVSLEASAPSSSSPEDKLVKLQKEMSSSLFLPKSQDTATEENARFLAHQQAVFDSMADFFASDDATPPEVVPILRHICNEILHQTISSSSSSSSKDHVRILDVACGTGALWPFYLEAASKLGVKTMNIVGVDLSSKMLEKAQLRADKLSTALNNNGFASIQLIHRDFCSLILDTNDNDNGNDNEDHRESFDAVVANACFGNFFDTDRVMDAMTQSLSPDGGVLFITHPLGASFVEKLHQQDPSTVPHMLPSRTEFDALVHARRHQSLTVTSFQETLINNNQTIYLASAARDNDNDNLG